MLNETAAERQNREQQELRAAMNCYESDEAYWAAVEAGEVYAD